MLPNFFLDVNYPVCVDQTLQSVALEGLVQRERMLRRASEAGRMQGI